MFATVTDIKRLQLVIGRAASIISKGDVAPIEQQLLLKATEGWLEVTGLDSTSHQLTLRVPADVVQPGTALVRPKDLPNRMKSLDSTPANLHLVEEGRFLRIEQQFDFHDFPIFAGTGRYPELTDLPETVAVIAPDRLKLLLTKLRQAKADPDQRVDVQIGEGQLLAYTGVLGFKYRQILDVETHGELKMSLAVNTLLKMPEFAGDVTICHDDNQLAFTCEEGTFWLRGIALDTLPRRLDDLFDAPRTGYWIANQGVLSNKLSGAIGDAPVRLDPQPTASMLHIQVRNNVEGGSRMVCGLEEVSGQTPEIWVNVANLQKGLDCLKTELALVEYLSHRNHVMLRVINEDDALSPRILVMPVTQERG